MMAALGWTCRDYARDPIVMLTCHAPGADTLALAKRPLALQP